MNKLQIRLEVKLLTQQWVANMMQQYGVSADVMEDALNGALLIIKDLSMQELLQELQTEQTPVHENEEENEDGRDDNTYNN